MKATSTRNDMFQFLRPFDHKLWLVILAMVCIFGVITFLIQALEGGTTKTKRKGTCENFILRSMGGPEARGIMKIIKSKRAEYLTVRKQVEQSSDNRLNAVIDACVGIR